MPSHDAWGRKLKPFRDVEVARIRYLSIEEARRLINASDSEFRPLVRAALETGARYSELARLEVADFNPDAGTVAIRKSKSGKGRHVVLTAEGAEFFSASCAGRAGTDVHSCRRQPVEGQRARPSDGRGQRAGKVEERQLSRVTAFLGERGGDGWGAVGFDRREPRSRRRQSRYCEALRAFQSVSFEGRRFARAHQSTVFGPTRRSCRCDKNFCFASGAKRPARRSFFCNKI